MIDAAIVVPARLGSQRFPRKLLEPVLGKPLILWTAENLQRIAPGVPVYFAVAEEELARILQQAGFETYMTDPELKSGTDRIAIANREIGARRVINVQADEPVISSVHIESLFALLDSGADVATLATSFESESDFKDPNKVKAVVSEDGRALYFSRAAVPFHRDSGGVESGHALWHMGVYAYTSEVLEAFLSWKQSALEQIEKLEQLRILENGYRIVVGHSETRTIGVDVAEDFRRLEAYLRKE